MEEIEYRMHSLFDDKTFSIRVLKTASSEVHRWAKQKLAYKASAQTDL